MNSTTYFTLAAICFGVAFAIAFNIALNAGCPPPLQTGVITSQGRVCLN